MQRRLVKAPTWPGPGAYSKGEQETVIELLKDTKATYTSIFEAFHRKVRTLCLALLLAITCATHAPSDCSTRTGLHLQPISITMRIARTTTSNRVDQVQVFTAPGTCLLKRIDASRSGIQP